MTENAINRSLLNVARTGLWASGLLAACMLAGPAWADDLDLNPAQPSSAVAWSGDALLRADFVRGVPDTRDINRLRTRLRYGPTWQINDAWTLAGALKLNEDSNSDAQSIAWCDNEKAHALSLDRLSLAYVPDAHNQLLLGQDALPLTLTPMLWDPNLRPQGLFYTWRSDFAASNAFRLTGGAFHGNLIYGDESHVLALQAALKFAEGAALEPEFIFTRMRFSNLYVEAQGPMARSNQVQNGQFVNGYSLADGQVILRFNNDWQPLRVTLDVDKNLGAGNQNQAGWLEVALGDSHRAHGWEAGLTAERIQEEAVVTAFNSDDWWYRSATRGDLLWMAYGFTDALRLRAAVYRERQDGDYGHSKRLLLDLLWNF